MQRPRLSLTTRIFVSSAGIVALILLVTLAVLQRSAMRAAEASITRTLESTSQRVQELVTAQREQLASRARVFADNPDYRSSVEHPQDAGDYFDYAETAAQQAGAQWAQILDASGTRLAKSDDRAAPPDNLSRSPLVSAALAGDLAQGFGVAGDSALIQTVALPIQGAGNGRVIGVLMLAKGITDSIARALGSQTQADIVFYALDRQDQPRLAAATDEARRSSAQLLASLASAMADSGTAVEQAGASADSTTAAASFDRMELGGEHFVGRRMVLASASGAPVGGFLALRSLDRELAASGYIQLRNTLLLAGAGGLLIALVFAGLTARRIVRPVTVLADASRRAAEGDYQAQIPEGGSDEIGTLASAFRRLLADLRDKQALVEFLSVSSGGATRTQTLATGAAAPTLKLTPVGSIVLEAGQTLANRYDIKSVLGVGGMGMVYKASDRELGEIVAIKTLKPDMIASDSSALERFKSEIRLARRISHRNVVRTHDLGETNGLYYITMEYVEGKSLKDLIKERGRLPASAVLPIAKQLCRALEVAHDEGVIHRDIKPQNMVVEPSGFLKVMDFGNPLGSKIGRAHV